MFLRNLLFLCFCAAVAAGIGLYVYHTHTYLVWGLLFLCWLCFRLKMRADNLFGGRSMQHAAVLPAEQNGVETRSDDASR